MASPSVPGATLEDLWACFVQCDRHAAETKSELDGDRKAALVWISAGAAYGLLASTHVSESFCAIVSTVSAALGAFYNQASVNADSEHQWVLARAVAETAKAEAYRFLARAKPYDAPDPAANERALYEKAAAFRNLIDEKFPGLEEPEGTARSAGMPSDWLAMDDYLAKRVQDQINYFRHKSSQCHRNAKNCKRWAVGLGVVSTLYGTGRFAAFIPDGILAHSLKVSLTCAGWVPVLASVTGAITTYQYQNRLSFVAKTYHATKARLQVCLKEWERLPSSERPLRQSEFINRFEDILSVENKQWAMEFDKSAQVAAPSAAPAANGASAAPARSASAQA